MEGKIWAVIPGYNEAEHISDVVRDARKYVESVVVVDDGSVDNTTYVAEKAGAIVLRHIINLGKGAALKTGCDYAILNGARYIIVLDADGQHEPKEIPRFLDALKDKDIIFGYRRMSKEMPFIFKLGNSFINYTIKLLYGLELKDSQSGYRAFKKEAYRLIRWDATDYSMESEMIANVGKNGLKYAEIPIQTIYSDKYKGTNVLDGIKIVLRMCWLRITR